MWLFILFLFLIVAVIIYTPLLMLAVVGAIVATIVYFVKLDWKKERGEGVFSLILLVIALVIIGGAYSYLGIWGAFAAIFLILAFVGMTS